MGSSATETRTATSTAIVRRSKGHREPFLTVGEISEVFRDEFDLLRPISGLGCRVQNNTFEILRPQRNRTSANFIVNTLGRVGNNASQIFAPRRRSRDTHRRAERQDPDQLDIRRSQKVMRRPLSRHRLWRRPTSQPRKSFRPSSSSNLEINESRFPCPTLQPRQPPLLSDHGIPKVTQPSQRSR